MDKKIILKEDTTESLLMAAGFIPVVGEVFDIVLIYRYLSRGEYLYAGLMLVALVPTVGDFIVKPFIKILKGVTGGTKLTLKSADDVVRIAKTNPQVRNAYLKVGEYLNNPKISQLIKQVDEIPGIGKKLSKGMSDALEQNKIAISKLKNTTKSVKNVTTSGTKLSGGIKKFFQERALANYVKKNGMEPSNWLKKWYFVIRQGRKDRRNLVKNFIIANGMLDLFGLPSFEAFESKFESDANFRDKLANDPKFSEIVNRSGISDEELSSIESREKPSTGGVLQNAVMNLTMLKTLARLFT